MKFIAFIALTQAVKNTHKASTILTKSPMTNSHGKELLQTKAHTSETNNRPQTFLQVEQCTDSDWVDSYGDGCWWYSANSWGCGFYDTDLGSAWDECCVCQGQCPDVWVDSYGDGCEWYVGNEWGCG